MDRSLFSRIETANAALLLDGDLERLGEFFAPDYVVHLTDRGRHAGLDAVRRHLESVRRAFADLEVEIELLLEGEDRVAWQRRLEGVQQGAFLGFPPTGRRVVWRDLATSRFRDGMIIEEWVVTDLAERLLRARKR